MQRSWAVTSSERMTVIVPCLNEENNVREAVEGILDVRPSLDVTVDVLLIDDGSTDRTGSVIDEICATHGFSAMKNARPLGLGRSVMNAYEQIDSASWITVLPGDNELDFSSIRNFLAIRASYDIVLGYLQNPVIRSAPRRFASWAFTQTVSAIYGFHYRYLNGLKLYRADVFKGIEVVSGGHAFNAELLAKAILRRPQLRIGEAPFYARGRAVGGSKAIRPASVARAVYEVGLGWRSVARFRHDIIRREDDK